MKKIKIHILFADNTPANARKAVENVFENFEQFLHFNEFSYRETQINVNKSGAISFFLSQQFICLLDKQQFDHQLWFFNEPLLIENQKKDYIGTCFYMINCLQEYANYPLDFLGRFNEELSYQKRFSCFEKNWVLDYFQEIALQIFGQKIPLKKTAVLLSHDIDFLHNGWKQALKNSIKKAQLVKAAGILLEKIKGKDPWQNINEIIELETKHQISSIFFWIPKKGKTPFKKIRNADYYLDEPLTKYYLNLIEKSALHKNALHKSISSHTIENERLILGNTSIMRYHYLKFTIPKDYPLIENAGIKEEHSLGFSKHIGFRNSWGLPFTPINPLTMQSYSFTVFPLHVMDSALYYFMGKQTPEEMTEACVSFIKQHPESCQLSILWHNNFVEKEAYNTFCKHIK